MTAQNWQELSQFGDNASSRLVEMLQTLDEQVQQGGGSGSQTVKVVDLGVIDLATAFSSDPITLYTMQAGEFLSTIRFTDTDIVESAPQELSRLAVGIGTVKSFAWYTFAWLRGTHYPGDQFDTLGFLNNAYAYSPGAVLSPDGVNAAGAVAMVLSAAAAGDIVLGIIDTTLSASSTGVRFKAPHAWAATTAYDVEVSPTPGTPPLVKAAILANGTIWVNTGAAGTSGGSSPDFAGNAGGTVTDGADIVWTDTNDAVFTAGTVRAVAEIWTPAAP